MRSSRSPTERWRDRPATSIERPETLATCPPSAQGARRARLCRPRRRRSENETCRTARDSRSDSSELAPCMRAIGPSTHGMVEKCSRQMKNPWTCTRYGGNTLALVEREKQPMRVLLVEDDITTRPRHHDDAEGERRRGRPRRYRRRGARTGPALRLRHRRARPDAPRHGGLRRAPPDARRPARHAGDDPLRPDPPAGQGEGLRDGRRRVHDEALRQGRAGRPHAGRDPPLQGLQPADAEDRRGEPEPRQPRGVRGRERRCT